MFGLEKYKDALGKPGKGMHAHGVFGFAILDLIATLVVAYLISHLVHINFFVCSILLLGLGVAAHQVFGVHTKINTFLFNSK